MSDLAIVLVALATVAGAVIAIRLSVSFDLNEFLCERQSQKKIAQASKAKFRCPHVYLSEVVYEGDLAYETRFEPAYFNVEGTAQWKCHMCGKIVPSEAMARSDIEVQKILFVRSLTGEVHFVARFPRFVRPIVRRLWRIYFRYYTGQ